ncbi:hypothetical protein BDV12DRAFT_204533 [Aspergillus spectabilis]
MQKEERARIWSQFHRGRDLRNQTVKHLGLGVLFSPSIWNHILSAQYLAFPLVADENDHWFTIIVSSQGRLANVENPTVYILDPSWYEWKKNLQQSIKQIITKAMAGSTAFRSATVRCYEATEGTLPQQSQELCGYYLMLYLELLATNPDALLTRVKEFNTAETRMDYLFEPGNMNGEPAERFAELIEHFQSKVFSTWCELDLTVLLIIDTLYDRGLPNF